MPPFNNDVIIHGLHVQFFQSVSGNVDLHLERILLGFLYWTYGLLPRSSFLNMVHSIIPDHVHDHPHDRFHDGVLLISYVHLKQTVAVHGSDVHKIQLRINVYDAQVQSYHYRVFYAPPNDPNSYLIWPWNSSKSIAMSMAVTVTVTTMLISLPHVIFLLLVAFILQRDREQYLDRELESERAIMFILCR